MKQYKDHYFRKAKQERYPARSVYKLQEIDKRFQLFSGGQTVLDLGAAPGSWSLYAAERIGSEGLVLAVDKLEAGTELPDNVRFRQDDVLDPSQELLRILDASRPFDLVISDMAPETSGIKIKDQARSLELAETAADYATAYLRSGGHFVAKVFDGPDVQEFTFNLKALFTKVKSFKPKSSRSESKESFILGMQRKESS
jgi:23S rRNA (uridine2552-2'-O)-methyltransferase